MKHVTRIALELRGKASTHRHEERKNRQYAEAYELAAILVENAIEEDIREETAAALQAAASTAGGNADQA